MNRALFFLWTALLRGRTLRFVRGLRRPTSCLGLAAVVVLLGVLFYFRNEKFFVRLLRTENLVGASLVMLCGSIFKGFLQRGLLCEPADIEFLFTSPFTHRQIVLYRLLPSYVFAVVQSLVFLGLFAGHLTHPLVTAICVALFQIACFHISTACSLFAGTLAEETHWRARWMLLAVFFLVTALYLRLAWNFRILPAVCSSPAAQFVFYPAVNLSDLANDGALHRWAMQFERTDQVRLVFSWQSALWLGVFGLLAVASLWWVLRFKANPFEAALKVSYHAAERRRRVQQGRSGGGAVAAPARSISLPKWAVFRGAGALLWKNWVGVRRARKEMLLAAFFTLTYTGAFTALLWIFHQMEKKGGPAPVLEARAFTTGIALFLGMLGFFLQRMFPFDFRQDGAHLLNFRTLPISPFGVALAEIAVPTALCLLAQGCGVVPLVLWGKFDWPTLVVVVFGFPAVALALNSVWNLHYLIAGARQIAGRPASSAVGVVLVVALSFLVLYPAGWATIKVANLFTDHNQSLAFTFAAAVGLAIQYVIDLLLIGLIGRVFRTFELAREA